MAVNGKNPKHRPSQKGCKCFHCVGYLPGTQHWFKGVAKLNAATRRALDKAADAERGTNIQED